MGENGIQRMNRRLYKAVMEMRSAEVVENIATASPETLTMLTPQGDTALHLAASAGDIGIVRVLISRKACMLLSRNVEGDSAYHRAAAAGNLEMVEFLLRLPSQLECNCDVEAIAHYVDTHSIWLRANAKKETALHNAARKGYAEIAELLMQRVQGIALICNDAGESPLYSACKEGHLSVVEKILQQDPSANISDSRTDGRTCLHAAILFPDPLYRELSFNLFMRIYDLFRRIFHRGETVELRQKIAEWDGLALLLISNRSHLVEKVDNLGNSPLHLATQYGNLKVVKKLVEANSDMCFRLNEEGMAAIHIAAQMGYVDIASSLLGSAPDCIQLLSKDKKNALHFAVQSRQYDLALRCLLQNDVEASCLINQSDNRGDTPLHTYFRRPSLFLWTSAEKAVGGKMSRLSMEKAENADGKTPFDLQIERGDIFSAWRALLEMSSDKNLLSEETLKRDKEEKQSLSVVAVLLATISFAAAFTIPGGYDSKNGAPVFMHASALKVFIIFDTLAMCLSMLALYVLILTPTTERTSIHMLQQRRQHGRDLVHLAASLTSVSFGVGIYVMVAPHCLWLAVMVCCLVSIISELIYFGNPLRSDPAFFLKFYQHSEEGDYFSFFN